MRSSPIQRPMHRADFGAPSDVSFARRRLHYWPLELDIHIRKLAELGAGAEQRWMAYLHSLASRRLASEDVAKASERIWNELSEELGAIVSPPNASPTDEGGVLMSWTRNGHHVELEVLPDAENYEWFYRHRASDFDETGADPVDTASDRLLERLRQLFA